MTNWSNATSKNPPNNHRIPHRDVFLFCALCYSKNIICTPDLMPFQPPLIFKGGSNIFPKNEKRNYYTINALAAHLWRNFLLANKSP